MVQSDPGGICRNSAKAKRGKHHQPGSVPAQAGHGGKNPQIGDPRTAGNLHPDGPLFQYSQSDRPARQQHRAVVCRGAIRDKAGTGSDGKHDAENL